MASMAKYRLILIFIVASLFLMGCVTIFDASAGELIDTKSHRSLWGAMLKQLSWGIAGSFIGTFCYRFGYRKFLKISPGLLYAACILLLLVFVPGIGISANGARRWVGLFGFSIQPSEFVKYIVPLYLIHVLSKGALRDRNEFYRILAPVAIALLLILLEPNNGTAFVISLTAGILILFLNVPVKFWIIPAACLVALSLIFAWKKGYVRARINTYLNPEQDIKGKGHQPHQAKIAAGSGGILGLGIGQSMQKLSYLPEAQNDYIAAIFAEEFGLLGISLLLGCYVLIGLLGLRIALSAEGLQAQLLAGCVTFLFCFQACMNLGVVSGLLPSTGLNLPFFSQGGSSLIANLSGLGLLLSCSCPMQAVNPTRKIVEFSS